MFFGDSPPYEYTAHFFPGVSFDEAVTPPESLLGGAVGRRLARHGEVLAAFRRWAQESPRMELATYGRTHEGRELVRAIVSSPDNLARLGEIAEALRALEDPRGLGDARADGLLDDTPAVAWLGYSIHGDETSGTDASLAVAYRLIAGTDAEIGELLERVVVVIDPCMNPDGRMRTVTQVEQNAGYVTNLDAFSRHRGHWPYGRGNHYLFDMNRDWMPGVCPETRARWKAARELPAQLFVDAHEMGGFDTYLFYPQSPPLNPYLSPSLPDWQKRFALDHSRAFDRHDWGYYTREWADAWAPVYSDAWGSLRGGIGLLYEQASVSGQPLRRRSGRVFSYREAVHGHVVSSLANVATLAANRREILADYLAFHRSAVDPQGEGARRAFVFVPGVHPDRERALIELLIEQGVEVRVARESFVARSVESTLLRETEERSFPDGTYLVSVCQPQAALVRSYLEFDPRMDEEALVRERESLEREAESTIYDGTAWDLGRAFDLDAFWCEPEPAPGDEAFPLVEAAAPPVAGVRDAGASSDAEVAYAYVVDGRADGSVGFAARALGLGLAVHISDEPFTTAGEFFERGSLLLRRHENGARFAERVAQAATGAGVEAVPTVSGRSVDDGPDLGGGHFHLLERPRVALLGGAPVEPDLYGHAWHLLDVELGLPFSILEAGDLSAYDLRRYNVLVVPPASPEAIGSILAGAAEQLSVWVRSGGVLIACGSSAAALAGLSDAEHELTSVALRRDALGELDAYAFAAEREHDARDVSVDLEALWGDAGGESGEADDAEPSQEPSREHAGRERDVAELERVDAWARRFAPPGAILRGNVDTGHWITVGTGSEMPVHFGGDHVLLSRSPVRTPVRLAEKSALRLGGLLWPEATERLAKSAWLTCERKDKGAVILFASAPAYRGFFRATARLLANAVVYGPGLGAEPAGDW